MISIGFFEPISICTLVMLRIAATAMPRPTGTEPVKLIASIPRLFDQLLPDLAARTQRPG